MFKDVLRAMEGATIYPIIGLLFFFCFFVGIVIWALRMRADHVEEMAQLPLDEDQTVDTMRKGE